VQFGRTKLGMPTFNQTFCVLFMRRIITLEDAIGRSPDPDELKTMIANAQAGGQAQGTPAQARPGQRPPLGKPTP